MKIMREILHIDQEKCDGCGKCVWYCVEGDLRIEDGKVHLVADKFCDACGDCVDKCPLGALEIVEREADEFQELIIQRC